MKSIFFPEGISAYLWAVVQHLYIKMGLTHNEGHVLVEAPYNDKYSRN